MKTITRHFATLKKAEAYQDKLYDQYERVRLIRSPRFDESGNYTWEAAVLPARAAKPLVNVALTSSEGVHTPGILAWARNGYAFPKDRPAMIRVISQTYGLRRKVAQGLLDGTIPYTIDGESVCFRYEQGKYLAAKQLVTKRLKKQDAH